MAASGLRRSDKEMEPAGVEEFLESSMVGRVGVISRGEPYVVPMNFAHQGNRVIVHGADEGRLISAIRDGSPVCFEVDEHTGTFPDPVLCQYDTGYVSVIGFGTGRVLEDNEERTAALRLIAAKYATKHNAERLHGTTVEKYRSADTGSATAVIELTLDRITGKANRLPAGEEDQ